MKDALEVKLVGGGPNWMPLCTRIALGLGGYYSPLPEGSTISVTTPEPGSNCFEAPVLVAEGKFHIGVATPGWIAKLAVAGRPPFTAPLPPSRSSPPGAPMSACSRKRSTRSRSRSTSAASSRHATT